VNASKLLRQFDGTSMPGGQGASWSMNWFKLIHGYKVRNRARRHAKTNPGDIKGRSQYKPLRRQRQFWHVDQSLLARGRVTFGTSTVTFGMSTGRYYFTIYYFPARSPSNTIFFSIGFRQFFPFPYCLLRNFQCQSKEESCFGIAQVTFGTSTGHFWHVDGSLLACRRVVLACRRFTFGMSTVVLACPRYGSHAIIMSKIILRFFYHFKGRN